MSDLNTYLEKHPQIRMGMYIPLNSAIVVAVYQESQESGCAMPTTLTELYTAMARTLLLRYLHGHPEYETVTMHTFNDLPPAVYTKFSELCKLAYKGIVGTRHHVQLIFTGLPSNFDSLGLMDSVTELYVTRGAVASHNFLHLTFQECFAAVHISTLSSTEQLEHFKRHEEGRLKVVLRFLAGLSQLSCFSKGNVHHFLAPSSCESNSPYSMPGVTIDLVNWMFEAQSIELLQENKTVEFRFTRYMLPLDYYCLGYCIAHSQCQWVFSIGFLGEKKMRMLVAGASTTQQPSDKVVGLRIGECEISVYLLHMLFAEWKSVLCLHELSLKLPAACDSITWPDLSALRVLSFGISGRTNWRLDNILPHLSLESLTITCINDGGDVGLVLEDSEAIVDYINSTTCLKELCFVCDKYESVVVVHNEGVEAITKALTGNQSLPLERLKLEWKCTFTDTAADSLVQFISNTTTLQYFRMQWCMFSAHRLLQLARAVHNNSTLQEKSLEYLSCTVNGDDEAKDFSQLLVEYPQVGGRYKWSIMINQIGNVGAIAIARTLHHNSTLKWLNLSNNSINDAGAVALAEALHFNSTLMWLKLSNNSTSINNGGAVALAQALHHNSTLEWLKLSNNSINDAGAVALAEALHFNSTLKWLILSNNSFNDAGAVALAEALRHNRTLKWLKLSNNSINDAGAVALAQALHHNSTLEWLKLSNNSIYDAGAVALAEALHFNSTLKWLKLSNNSINDAGAVALAEALCHNRTLKWLKLSNNSINDAGAVALAQALHDNSTLKWLKLSNNSINDSVAIALAQALHHNHTLKWLILSNNNVNDSGAVALAEALHHNRTLKWLKLSNNSINDAGAVALAQALHHNSTLEWLKLSNNSINDSGAIALAQALHRNRNLEILDLSNNNISDTGIIALAQVLHHNSRVSMMV